MLDVGRESAEARVREYLDWTNEAAWQVPPIVRIVPGWGIRAEHSMRPDDPAVLTVGDQLALYADGQVLRGLLARELAYAYADGPRRRWAIVGARFAPPAGKTALVAYVVAYFLDSSALALAALVTGLLALVIGLRSAQILRGDIYEADARASAWASAHALVTALEWQAEREGQPTRVRRARRNPWVTRPTYAERLAALHAYRSELA